MHLVLRWRIWIARRACFLRSVAAGGGPRRAGLLPKHNLAAGGFRIAFYAAQNDCVTLDDSIVQSFSHHASAATDRGMAEYSSHDFGVLADGCRVKDLTCHLAGTADFRAAKHLAVDLRVFADPRVAIGFRVAMQPAKPILAEIGLKLDVTPSRPVRSDDAMERCAASNPGVALIEGEFSRHGPSGNSRKVLISSD
jgi:hypothetical protein